ncbi:MAG: hypothetical protein SCK57_02755 [Bacillota bacterium]|nr:hypothetical protein [Bacillota bacterium]MDW7676559.1 hypothetical protein [Bacillota bacterium]
MKRKHIKIIIVLTVLLLAAAAGLAIPALLHPGEDTEAIPVTGQPDAEADAGNPVMLPPGTGEDPSTPDPAPDTPVSDSTGTTDEPALNNPAQPTDSPANARAGMDGNPGTTDEPALNNPAQPTDSPANARAGMDGNSGTPDNLLAEADLTNQTWVEAKIEENRDLIADEDLDDFRAIIGKLDMNHINDILERRVAQDVPMEDALRTYLRSRLNAAEYERAKELFVTYEHLLFG